MTTSSTYCCDKLSIAFWSDDGYTDKEKDIKVVGYRREDGKREYMVYDMKNQDTLPMGDICAFCGSNIE